MRLAPPLVLLLLLAPSALGAEATGEFLAQGGLALPTQAQVRPRALAAFLDAPEGEALVAFTLEAAKVRVHRFEERYADLGEPVRVNPYVGGSNVSYTLHDVTVTLDRGDHSGWLGLYFPPAGRDVLLEGWAGSQVRAVTDLTLGQSRSALNEADGPRPDFSGYEWEGRGPLLELTVPGVLTREGAGSMKVHGADLHVASRENSTRIRTGEVYEGEVPQRQRIVRWVFLEFEDARLLVASREPVRMAAAEAAASWSGVASFTPVEGSLDSDGVEYRPTGRRVQVAGSLNAFIEPDASATSARMRLALSGDLARTTLAPQRSVAVPLAPSSNGWGFVVGALALVGIAVLVTARVLAGRARPKDPLSPEQRVALALLAAGREHFQEAVAHVRRARAQAPTSVRLVLEEAAYLGAMGRIDEALATYERAARLDPDCDAEFQAAVLLLQSEVDPARAEELLANALRKTPILVLEVLYDVSGTFLPLRGRPAFEEAVAAARRALGEA